MYKFFLCDSAISTCSIKRLSWVCLLLTLKATVNPAIATTISDEDADHVRAAILIAGVSVAAFQRDTAGIGQLGKSLLAVSATTLGLKKIVAAERPNGLDNDSFPSGHVSVSVAGAAFLHERYGLSYSLPAYLAAAAIAQNRLENDHHRVGDILASTALALTLNHKFTSPLPITAGVSENRIVFKLSFTL